LLEGEISVLGKVMKKPKRPLLAILGGAKISSKLPLLEYFLKNADAIITGGAMANTILAAQHVGVGKSLMDRTADLSWLKSKNKKIHLPVDATLTAAFDGKKPHRISGVRNIREDEIIADVGPDSIELFSALVRSSKTIVWNGPLGYAEVPAYAKGTEAMARALAKSKALTVIGGGDLTRIIRKLKLDKKITHISTGGGAMLEFLAGKKLPGIEALK
jgi:3-phosphoglycerate kinase